MEVNRLAGLVGDKRALAIALKELMREKPLVKISIADIVGRCGMNRQSFYYHFRDKYDLVNWIFYTELITELKRSEMQANGRSWAIYSTTSIKIAAFI